MFGKRRRIWAILLAVLVLTLALSYGAGAATRKIVVANVGSLDGTQKAIAEFTAKTGIEVELVVLYWSTFNEKITMMLATGQQLDCIRFDTGHAVAAALNGWIRPLTPFIERDNLNLNVWPPTVLWLEPWSEFGEIYVLPYNIAVSTMFYNRAHFQDAGVAYYPTQYGHPELQWDTWKQGLKKLTRIGANGQVERWGTNVSVGTEGYYLMGMFDASWATPRVDQFLGATPEVSDGMQQMIDLWLVDGVAPQIHQRNAVSLQAGNVATQLRQTGSWMVSIDPTQLDLGLAPLPWAKDVAVQGGVNSWGISATSKDVEAAWEFVKYFTYDEGYLAWLQYESLSPPCHRNYWRAWTEVMQPAMPNADFLVALEGANHLRNNTLMTMSPVWDSTMKAIFEGAIKQASGGEMPVKAAMEAIEDTMNALLRDNPVFK